MTRLLFIFSIFSFSLGMAQNANKDSLYVFTNNVNNGGEFTMEIDEDLAKLMMSKEQKVCNKPVYVPPKKLTPADKCASQQKIMGYKVQIFYTKDREAANKVKNDFSRQFPSLTAELIYASPDYRILVGDYFTRSSASPDLRRIQRSYPSAFSVQWRVWCRKAI